MDGTGDAELFSCGIAHLNRFKSAQESDYREELASDRGQRYYDLRERISVPRYVYGGLSNF